MDNLSTLILTIVLILVPLVPASIIYLLLTPKSKRGKDQAQGNINSDFLSFGKLSIQFNVFGSTVTYILVLLAAVIIFDRFDSNRVKIESLADNQAWRVEVPVFFKSESETQVALPYSEMERVEVRLLPSNLEHTSGSISFTVVPSNGKFPSVEVIKAGFKPSDSINLDDESLVKRDYFERKLQSFKPAWLEIPRPYNQ